jgi:hypothetical protein
VIGLWRLPRSDGPARPPIKFAVSAQLERSMRGAVPGLGDGTVIEKFRVQPVIAAVFDLAQTHQFLAANDKTNLITRCFKQAKGDQCAPCYHHWHYWCSLPVAAGSERWIA